VTDDGFQQVADTIRRAGEGAVPRDDCPTAQRIWGAVKLELPLTERLEIIDHTTECLACAEAWRIAMTLGDRTASAEHGPERTRSSWMLTGARAAGVLLAVAGLAYFIMRRDAPPVDPPTAQTMPATQPMPATEPPRPATSPVVVSLNDGAGRVTLTADGTLTTSRALAGSDAERVKQALLTRRLASSPVLDHVKTGAGTLMGGAGGPRFRLASPVGTMVEDERPTLAWSRLAGAHGYEVTISDVAANYAHVVTSPRLRETVWTVPTPLTRGRTYSWQVVAFTAEGEVKAPSAEQGEARFAVMSLDAAEAVVKARIAYKDEHLVLGVTYAAAGLLDEAEAELGALAAANPGSSVAADLLRSLREMRTGQK
jgi:hypothetical protein